MQSSLTSKLSRFHPWPNIVARRHSLIKVLDFWLDSQRIWSMVTFNVSAPIVVAWWTKGGGWMGRRLHNLNRKWCISFFVHQKVILGILEGCTSEVWICAIMSWCTLQIAVEILHLASTHNDCNIVEPVPIENSILIFSWRGVDGWRTLFCHTTSTQHCNAFVCLSSSILHLFHEIVTIFMWENTRWHEW